MFITFEGIDGCGKSTQSKRLEQSLTQLKKNIILTREPGGSDGAELIRKLLVEGSTDRWSPETEILLFTAARRDHLERIIWPALKQNKIVISDRFVDSTRVYQGVARADLYDIVNKLHDQIIQCEPDLTFIIDVDPKISLKRGLARDSGEDRFEDFGLEFQKKLRAGFLKIAEQAPQRCKIINGNNSINSIAAEILAHVNMVLND